MIKAKGGVIWLMIAGAIGAGAHFAFDANFWIISSLVLVSLPIHALFIEWEDNQPGGWSADD